MRSLRIIFGFTLLLILAALTAAACGSEGDAGETTPSPSPSPVPMTSVTPVPTVTSTGQVTDLLRSGEYGNLARALAGTGLTTTLAGEGPWTLFAPDQEAFTPEVAAALVKAAANGQVKGILEYHVVKGQIIDINTMTSGTTVTTLQGSPITLDSSSGAWTVNGVPILEGTMAPNGAVYRISSLLMPPSPGASSPSPSPSPSP
jgi:uncharacterized surface protein with fasciclin (FAS1) repeats